MPAPIEVSLSSTPSPATSSRSPNDAGHLAGRRTTPDCTRRSSSRQRRRHVRGDRFATATAMESSHRRPGYDPAAIAARSTASSFHIYRFERRRSRRRAPAASRSLQDRATARSPAGDKARRQHARRRASTCADAPCGAIDRDASSDGTHGHRHWRASVAAEASLGAGYHAARRRLDGGRIPRSSGSAAAQRRRAGRSAARRRSRSCKYRIVRQPSHRRLSIRPA